MMQTIYETQGRGREYSLKKLEMINLLHRILCALGLHRWIYFETNSGYRMGIWKLDRPLRWYKCRWCNKERSMEEA
jgi:hypothetical protein